MWLRDGERSSGMVIDLGAEAWSTLRRTAARSASARHGWRDGSGGPIPAMLVGPPETFAANNTTRLGAKA